MDKKKEKRTGLMLLCHIFMDNKNQSVTREVVEVRPTLQVLPHFKTFENMKIKILVSLLSEKYFALL